MSSPSKSLPLALILAALAPAIADANVTRSSVTSPADPTYRLYEPTKKAEPRLAVAGTTDGAVKEQVDLVCSEGATVFVVAPAIELGSEGRFAADVPLKSFQNRACILRAVPAGYRGKELQRFAGPIVAVTFFDANAVTVPVRGGGVATHDYAVVTGHRRARASLRSVGNSGVEYQTGVHPEELGGFSQDTWDQAATLARESKETETALVVDGRVAYSAAGVPLFVYQGEDVLSAPAGHEGVRARLALDERTGAVRVEEAQRIERCNRSDGPLPPAADCTSVLDTGVRLERTITFDAEHAVTRISDRWISADGNPHRVRLAYTHDADDKEPPRWRFPGEPGFSFRSEPEAVQPKAPGTLFVRGAMLRLRRHRRARKLCRNGCAACLPACLCRRPRLERRA